MHSQKPALLTFLILAVIIVPLAFLRISRNGGTANSIDSTLTPQEESSQGIVFIGGGDRPVGNSVSVSHDGTSWRTIVTDALFPMRTSENLVFFNHAIYMYGGYGYNNGSFNYNDVWKSTDGAEWTELAAHAPWQKRSGSAGVVFNDKMYLIGGETYNAASSTFYNDVWTSADGINWKKEKKSAPWNPRAVGASAVFQNKIWIMGGSSYVVNTDGTYDFTTYNDVWSYDGSAWQKELDTAPWASDEVGAVAAFVLNEKLFVIADDGFHSSPSVWSTTDGINWVEVNNAPAFSNYNFAPVVFNNQVWLFGGTANEEQYSHAWYSTDGIQWTESQKDFPQSAGEGRKAVVAPLFY